MKNKKLTWEEIEKLYSEEYVELVDYDWPDEQIHPKSGVVKVHSSNREDFYKRAGKNIPVDSAIVFVGQQKLPKDVIFSPGMRRVVPNHA